MKTPLHITDMTRQDFDEIARAANMRGEDGVNIEPQGDRNVVKLDQSWLRAFVKRMRESGEI